MEPVCAFAAGGPSAADGAGAHAHSHSDANGHSHAHDHRHAHGALEHGRSHEVLDHPGKYGERDLPNYSGRRWDERAFTVGIGGPVGSGKTALLLALCKRLRDRFNLGAVSYTHLRAHET